ncbi:uncharacterized protein [Malus domestica]|uniref:uncharacterized protein n=1 Tax=Malus domestica TaxID=3750 RepID=UPI0039749188
MGVGTDVKYTDCNWAGPCKAYDDCNGRCTGGKYIQVMTNPTVKVENLLGMLTIKLKDDNFAKWAFQFKAVLKGYKLFGHFDGTDVCPPMFVLTTDLRVTEEITKAYVDWESTDMALLSLLLATLSDEAMEYVLGCKNAYEAWVNLVDRFASVSKSIVNHLKTELHTIQKGSDSIDKYLLRLKNSIAQLSAVGKYVLDNDVIIAGLARLPKQYAIIRIVILARESSITLKEFRAQLLGAEKEIKGEINMLSQSLSALYVKGTGTNPGSSMVNGSSSNPQNHNHIPASTGGVLSQIQEIKVQILISDLSKALILRVNTITGPIMDTRGRILILKDIGRTQIPMDKKTKEVLYHGKSRPTELFQIPVFHSVKGIVQMLSYPCTPQQNGIAERKHRHIIETSITLLTNAGLPLEFWYFACAHSTPSTHEVNQRHSENDRITSSSVSQSETSSSSSGHSQSQSTSGHTLSTTSDTTHLLPVFSPDQLHVILPLSSNSYPSGIEQTTTSTPVHQSSGIQIRLQTGALSRKNYAAHLATFPEIASLKVMDDFSSGFSLLVDITNIEEPKNYKTASVKVEWQRAMQDEFDALKAQGTWCLVPPPVDKSIVGNKWVYKIKKNLDGSISRYKARLVAQGYSQEQGLDYSETFSPVVRHTTVRMILALAVQFGWSLRQLDIKNAFLHGELEEEVYMQQPQGFVDSQHPNYICRLIKSLYGLKQAPRAWNSKFTSYLPTLGFVTSLSDTSLFVKEDHGDVILLLLYVDDIIVTGSNASKIQSVITSLAAVFDLKEMGKLTYFLGLHIQYNQDGSIFINQSKYARALKLRTALTAFSSFLAAALGAFFLMTTGSQSCVMGPPDMAIGCGRGVRGVGDFWALEEGCLVLVAILRQSKRAFGREARGVHWGGEDMGGNERLLVWCVGTL